MVENPKYRLTDETIVHDGKTVFRIEALRDFENVAAGDLGGFVESEYNLSHDGNCWVGRNSVVFGSARVIDDAVVKNNSVVSGNARIAGQSSVVGTNVSDNATNAAAKPAVIFVSNVAPARAPNAAWLLPPPNALAMSPPLPCCNRITRISSRQTNT